MEIVKVTGFIGKVDLNDFANETNKIFGNNPEIGTFRVRQGDHEGIMEMVFENSYAAIEGQRLIHKSTFTCPRTNNSHVLRAKVLKEKDGAVSVHRSQFNIEDQSPPEILRRLSKIERKLKKDQKNLETDKIDSTVPYHRQTEDHKETSYKRERTPDNRKSSRRSRSSDRFGGRTSYRSRSRDRTSYRSRSRDRTSYRSRSRDRTSSYKRSFRDVDKRSIESLSDDDDPLRKRYGDVKTYRRQSEDRTLHKRRDDRESSYRRTFREETYKDYKDTSNKGSRSRNYDYDDFKHRSDSKSKDPRDHYKFYQNSRDYKYKTQSSTNTGREQVLSSNTSKYNSNHRIEKGNWADDREISNIQRKLLDKFNLKNYTYLHDNEVRLQEVVDKLMFYVGFDDVPNFVSLEDSDKTIIYAYFRKHVLQRLKDLKIPCSLETPCILVDYKLKFKTKEDKLLVNVLCKELVNLGQDKVQSMNSEELSEAIDDVLKKVQIENLIEEDIKPDVNQIKLEEYNTEDNEDPGTINITINFTKKQNYIPIDTGDLPYQTEPEKIQQIKEMTKTIKQMKPKKFFLPIKQIIKNMRIHIYNNMNVVPCEVMVEKLIFVLEKIIENLLIGQTKIGARDVTKLFRKAYPSEKDSEFVNNIIQWILDGAFDKEDYLEKLLILKQEMHEIIEEGEIISDDDEVDIKKEKVYIKKEDEIKTEPIYENTTEDITEPVKIKTEIIDITDDENIKEEIIKPVIVKTEIIDITEDQDDDMPEVIDEPVQIKTELPDISEEMDTIDDVINSCKDIKDETEIKTEFNKVEDINTETSEDKNTTTPENAEKMPINTSAENVTAISSNTVQTSTVPEGESIDDIRSFILNLCPNNQTTDDLVSSLLG